MLSYPKRKIEQHLPEHLIDPHDSLLRGPQGSPSNSATTCQSLIKTLHVDITTHRYTKEYIYTQLHTLSYICFYIETYVYIHIHHLSIPLCPTQFNESPSNLAFSKHHIHFCTSPEHRQIRTTEHPLIYAIFRPYHLFYKLWDGSTCHCKQRLPHI